MGEYKKKYTVSFVNGIRIYVRNGANEKNFKEMTKKLKNSMNEDSVEVLDSPSSEKIYIWKVANETPYRITLLKCACKQKKSSSTSTTVHSAAGLNTCGMDKHSSWEVLLMDVGSSEIAKACDLFVLPSSSSFEKLPALVDTCMLNWVTIDRTAASYYRKKITDWLNKKLLNKTLDMALKPCSNDFLKRSGIKYYANPHCDLQTMETPHSTHKVLVEQTESEIVKAALLWIFLEDNKLLNDQIKEKFAHILKKTQDLNSSMQNVSGATKAGSYSEQSVKNFSASTVYNSAMYGSGMFPPESNNYGSGMLRSDSNRYGSGIFAQSNYGVGYSTFQRRSLMQPFSNSTFSSIPHSLSADGREKEIEVLRGKLEAYETQLNRQNSGTVVAKLTSLYTTMDKIMKKRVKVDHLIKEDSALSRAISLLLRDYMFHSNVDSLIQIGKDIQQNIKRCKDVTNYVQKFMDDLYPLKLHQKVVSVKALIEELEEVTKSSAELIENEDAYIDESFAELIRDYSNWKGDYLECKKSTDLAVEGIRNSLTSFCQAIERLCCGKDSSMPEMSGLLDKKTLFEILARETNMLKESFIVPYTIKAILDELKSRYEKIIQVEKHKQNIPADIIYSECSQPNSEQSSSPVMLDQEEKNLPTLLKFISQAKNVSSSFKVMVIKDVFKELQCMHQSGFLYLYVTPANILVSSGAVLVNTSEASTYEPFLPFKFIAPECERFTPDIVMLFQQENFKDIHIKDKVLLGPTADVYSLGQLIRWLLCVDSVDDDSIQRMITVKDTYPILGRLLDRIPLNRPTLDELENMEFFEMLNTMFMKDDSSYEQRYEHSSNDNNAMPSALITHVTEATALPIVNETRLIIKSVEICPDRAKSVKVDICPDRAKSVKVDICPDRAKSVKVDICPDRAECVMRKNCHEELPSSEISSHPSSDSFEKDHVTIPYKEVEEEEEEEKAASNKASDAVSYAALVKEEEEAIMREMMDDSDTGESELHNHDEDSETYFEKESASEVSCDRDSSLPAINHDEFIVILENPARKSLVQ